MTERWWSERPRVQCPGCGGFDDTVDDLEVGEVLNCPWCEEDIKLVEIQERQWAWEIQPR